jgi:dienelactone hydrolase
MSVCANIKSHVKLLTFHGDVDEIIPHSDSQCLHALLTQSSDQSKHVYELPADSNVRHSFITIQGSDHGYTKHAEQACVIAMQWLLPKLQTL